MSGPIATAPVFMICTARMNRYIAGTNRRNLWTMYQALRGGSNGPPVDDVPGLVDLVGNAVLPVDLDELLELQFEFFSALGHGILGVAAGGGARRHGTSRREPAQWPSFGVRSPAGRTTRGAPGIDRPARTRSSRIPSHSVRPPVAPGPGGDVPVRDARVSVDGDHVEGRPDVFLMTARPSIDDLVASHPRLPERTDPVDRVLREQRGDVDGIVRHPGIEVPPKPVLEARPVHPRTLPPIH